MDYVKLNRNALYLRKNKVTDLVPFEGVFAPLQDRNYFVQVRVNPDTGTICWPNDADLDPDVLYAMVTGEPLPDFPLPVLLSD
jgi:hypothetical protein